MKSHKFAIDIPRLNIGSSKADAIAGKDRALFFYESPPPTPKSVRPSLPLNVESELRAACKYVVDNYRPSHEDWSVTNPQCNLQSTINAGAGMPHVKIPAHRSYHVSELQIQTQYARKEVARDRVIRDTVARAEQPMASTTSQNAPNYTRYSSDQTIYATSDSQPSIWQNGSDQRYASSRSDVMETFRSSPQTDSTGYPWTSSTGVTSVVATPIRSSNLASIFPRYESHATKKNDSRTASTVRSDLDRRQMVASEQNLPGHQKIQSVGAKVTQHSLPSKTLHRKPVPFHQHSSQASDNAPVFATEQNRSSAKQATTSSTNASSGNLERVDRRGRTATRLDARNDKASRTASLVASRAASRARSVTRDIRTFFRRASSIEPGFQGRPHRSTQDLKGGITAVSLEDPNGPGVRSTSLGYLHNKVSHFASTVFPQHYKGSKQSRQSAHVNSASGFVSSTNEADITRCYSTDHDVDCERTKPTHLRRTMIDLNRELPPLPSLDQWETSQNDGPDTLACDVRSEKSSVYQRNDLSSPNAVPVRMFTPPMESEPHGLLRRSEHSRRLERQSNLPNRMEDLSLEDRSQYSGNSSYSEMTKDTHTRPRSMKPFPASYVTERSSNKPEAEVRGSGAGSWAHENLAAHRGVAQSSTFPFPSSHNKDTSKWKWWHGKGRRPLRQETIV